MTEDEKDPFEGLVLDEDFIKGAKAYEPPARTREAVARYKPEPPRAWTPAKTSRTSGNRTTWVIVGVIIALIVGGVVLQRALQPSPAPTAVNHVVGDPMASPSPSSTAARPDQTVADDTFTPGHCYTWDQHALDATGSEVPCVGLHLYEHVAKTRLTGHDGAGEPYPTESQWTALVGTLCNGRVTAYLHATLDPTGRYYLSDLRPSRHGWAVGDRKVDCGLGEHVSSTTLPDDLDDPFTGKVDPKHQFDLRLVGTCYGSPGGSGAQVLCSSRHDLEAVGSATVDGTSRPSTARQNQLVEGTCDRLVTAFLGHVPAAGHEEESWDTLSAASWAAGTRQVNCYLLFPTHTYVTGSHRSVGKSA